MSDLETVLQFSLPKRTMFHLSKAKKVLSPEMLIEHQKMLKAKAVFFSYCQHFKTKTLAELLDDKILIQMMHNLAYKEPILNSRAFQVALEVTYFKRRFSETLLQDVCKNDFKIQDTFLVNNGMCDRSTLYSSILAKQLCMYFNLNFNDVIVHSTPLFLTQEKITPEIKTTMDYNRKMTGNTCSDIDIKQRPYDFKESQQFSYAKNQIYFLEAEKIRDQGFKIFEKLQASLEYSLKDSQQILSKEGRAFTIHVIKFLQNERQTQVSMEIVLENLNMFLHKSNMPPDFKIPLFIPTKKAALDSLYSGEQVDKVILDHGTLTSDNNIKAKIQEATHNSIQFDIPKLEELD